ncbi:MAG: glycosyltransferase family 4 protein [Lachnospiraceae bacterium]|nr:glycosyltransferase family 4 protein [Lachnospiraceae bacterium]
MHLLVVSHEFPPIGGGGANACYFLTTEFVKQGHSVTVVTASYQNLPTEESINGVRILRVKAKREKKETSTFAEMLSYLISAFSKVKALVREETYDHCVVFFGIPSGPLGWYLKKRYQIPYTIRLGGGDIPGAQKRFAIIYKILSPMIRSIWRNADHLIANSEGLREKAYGYEKRYPIGIISNGVDGDFFCADTKREHESDCCRLLFVSRLIEGKGLQYVIPHMEKINRESGKYVQLTIVGDGPYREELQRLVEQNNVEKFVEFVGMKTKEELLPYYQQADLFILPSLSEGMPNVVLEAMATGLPIVMTPCGGSKEMIHGNGVIAPIDDFVMQVIELCKDEEKREAFGICSAKLTKERFAWNAKASEYLDLIAAK